jgi:hypothetical protein
MGIFDAASLPSGPTSKQINTSDIQSWAQPYISSYLNKSQALSNQAPTAFQNQVYSSAQGMGDPEQFAMGTNLANQGGQGSLSTAPIALNYGQMGATTGAQGVGIGQAGMQYGMNAGQNYAQQATNPYAVGAYMNPYVQQSLAPQLALLNQQQQLGAQGIAAQAAGKGAFGGNRTTLAQGLNAQNYDLARQQAIGQGYNTAFQNAQQAQQFGANLGLQGAMQGTAAGLQGIGTALQGTGLGLQGVQGAQQGYQGATQAGSTLGQIGSALGQYQLNKLALQNQIAQQQYQQPFQQQQFMQGMLSGLPITSGTTTGFQAPPNALSQMTGLAGTAITGAALANKMGLFDRRTPSTSGGSYIPNFNSAMDNRDVGLPTTSLSSMPAVSLPYDTLGGDAGYSDLFAEGGSVQSYASGGIVSLALNKALKG